MLSIYTRWRIVKSIESGEPMPRSITAALEKAPELRAYADSMRRVHEGLCSPEEVYGSVGLAQRVLREIEGDPAHAQTNDRTNDRTNDKTRDGTKTADARLEPMGFIRPLGLAAAVVLVSGITVLSIRPWSARPMIEVTGEFTSLISLFQPIGDEGLIAWMDRSLADEMNAIAQDAQDAQNKAQSVIDGIPGAALIGKNQGDQPD